MTYPKIETLFNRDKDFNVNVNDFRLPEYKLIEKWLVTEKIHGQNIHIQFKPTTEVVGYLGPTCRQLKYTGHTINFLGRSEKTHIPKPLLQHLNKKFTVQTFKNSFEIEQNSRIDIYGEGYGTGINNGGNYNKGLSFRIFDVFVHDQENPLGGWWLEQGNILDIAKKFEVETCPVLGYLTVPEIIDMVKSARDSNVALKENNTHHTFEGVVARSVPLLFTRKGERLMWKLKVKDFNHKLKQPRKGKAGRFYSLTPKAEETLKALNGIINGKTPEDESNESKQ